MKSPLIEIRDLHLSFTNGTAETEILHGVDLNLQRGEILGVIGESGSGKTMTGMALLRLLPDNARVRAGKMDFDGSALPPLTEAEFNGLRGIRLAMIFQDPSGSFNPAKRIFWHFRQILNRSRLKSTSRYPDGSRTRETALQLMRDVGIKRAEEALDLYPHQLSGGMLQRVLIALVLALEPDLIVADEPTTNLDKIVERQILDLFLDLRSRLDAGIIFVTHDMGVAASLCDRIAVMRYGEVLETGPARQIFEDPQHEYTKLLISTAREISDAPVKAAPAADLPPAPALFSLENIDLTFPASGARPPFKALQSVSLDIREGEILGLVGESGSGKTTLGRTLLRLYEPSAGRLTYRGKDITHISERAMRPMRRELQMVFQDPGSSFNPRYTMGRSMADALRMAGVPKDRIRERITGLFTRVGLSAAHADRFPHELSGGQLQRVGIARAVALDPRLIVADEAVSKLDVSVRSGVLRLFREIQREKQLSMVFITHDLEVARFMCDRIAILYHGKLLEIGPTARIFAAPGHEYTKALLSTLDYGLGGAKFGERAV